jgi:hypothetical protein
MLNKSMLDGGALVSLKTAKSRSWGTALVAFLCLSNASAWLRARVACATRLLSLLLLLSLPAAVQAEDFLYTTNDGTITITDYMGPGGDVSIPGMINSLPVTRIRYNAFLSCINLSRITIPTNVTTVGANAFSLCTGLSSILVPNSVTNIGFGAFSGCASLSNITIPTNLTMIDDWAFVDCSSLINLVIPDSVTSIGVGAFSSCTGLTSVIVPNSVTIISSNAFQNCSSLTNIHLSDKLTRIEPVTFSGLISLASLRIPDAVTSIGMGAFSLCSSLTRVTIPNSVSNLDMFAFSDCPSLTNVTIGSNVSYMPAYMFSRCSALSAVYFTGNAPETNRDVFFEAPWVNVYYLPGTTNWGSSFAGRPTVLWNPVAQRSDAGFGVGTNGFGFNITGTTNIPVLVEGSTGLGGSGWVPLQSANLTNGSIYFNDPDWINHPARYYRLRSP